jgi:predicted signal transduction protein with EAL and GGDEF domain
VGMARGLGLRVVAEGVEQEEQRQFLAGIGCDEVQGHLVSRPVPASRITRVMRERQAGVERWPAVCPVARELDEHALSGLLSGAQQAS